MNTVEKQEKDTEVGNDRKPIDLGNGFLQFKALSELLEEVAFRALECSSPNDNPELSDKINQVHSLSGVMNRLLDEGETYIVHALDLYERHLLDEMNKEILNLTYWLNSRDKEKLIKMMKTYGQKKAKEIGITL